MPAAGVAEFQLDDEEAARRFGARLGRCLRPGDTLLLEGPVGAGKSHIARAAIRALAGAATEVPSPTFTLVQTYDGPSCEIWHADLYRLSSSVEVAELGLAEAMGRDIVLIEWPDRLGLEQPAEAIRLRLVLRGEGREAQLSGAPARLMTCLMQEARP
ncbi:tRNA (adenosine(37)-N6)-threonylcarbamoyltransferase complex ATPase subunit type 1 TsaE [Rhodobacter sp. Har01]|uniref:tRNA (adenosine(37)-N6)-threonylcarbamoyltransferase complex ATPase subunit type 1 TsaE n=1 Tax=Rhodobacter sp. Har01 TaxID=2883999 RepID=UPI001D0946CE|nr:tRNA (adenosine(37)-N6)-threonylcarbamoyltransferase complex ATPase subunit type 1 TsaE [Rhodobacter sp. Har01]MCB6177903.1 tRNA (adenosine(37)-N6)-threonylcarbamoyltransferase complex ATPase subunit type 1 TsaE [Rhodobacter sp. Har01]